MNYISSRQGIRISQNPVPCLAKIGIIYRKFNVSTKCHIYDVEEYQKK